MKLFLILVSVVLAASAGFEPLPVAKLHRMTSKPTCSFVHVWAAWCTICVQELPALLTFLGEEKKVQSIVIDVSHPLARAQFSKPYLEKISPKFTTYYKPA